MKMRTILIFSAQRDTAETFSMSMHVDNGNAPDYVLHELGDRLRHLRKARKLRQLDMEDLGLSYKYYQRLESGQVNPTLLTLHRVALALDVSVHDLFRPGHGYDTQAP
jgi:DNA-binding XRE family transcriptional regulator